MQLPFDLEMELRPLAESDLEGLAALYARVFNEAPWNDGWTKQAARERLLRLLANPDALGVVAVDGSDVFGFALGTRERWVDADHFHLKEMCTAPEHRRTGIGSAVLESLSAYLWSQGVGAMYLQTAPGGPAHMFYRKHGFRVIELETMFRSGMSGGQ